MSIIPLLTRVSSKCFHFAKFIFYAFHFQPECCSILFFLVPCLPRFNRNTCLYFLSIETFFMSFNLQGSSIVPCSSFLTECFQLCSSLLYSFFQFVQPRKGSLTSLVCQRSNLVLPLLFLFRFPLRCHSRSRDEILS